MGIETIVGGGLSLLGGAMSADAAGDAAETQAAATREANAVAREQNQQIRSDLAPFRSIGVGASNKLATLLGLDAPGAGAVSAADREAIRARLLPQFTSAPSAGAAPAASQFPEWMRASPQVMALYAAQNGIPLPGDPAFGSSGEEQGRIVSFNAPGQPAGAVDEQALNAAIEAEIARMGAQGGGDRSSADFGSLLRNFTGEDLENEPGFQFGLDQGMKALNNRLAAGGSFFSGAALKGGQRFAQDYAGTKFNDAFNRDSANKTRTFNFLSGPMSLGQNAAAQTGNAGMNMAGQVGANTTAMGNAQGAARIAQGNALAGGLNGAAGAFQQNELLRRITGGNSGWDGLQGRFSNTGLGGSGFGSGLAYGNQDFGQFI